MASDEVSLMGGINPGRGMQAVSGAASCRSNLCMRAWGTDLSCTGDRPAAAGRRLITVHPPECSPLLATVSLKNWRMPGGNRPVPGLHSGKIDRRGAVLENEAPLSHNLPSRFDEFPSAEFTFSCKSLLQPARSKADGRSSKLHRHPATGRLNNAG